MIFPLRQLFLLFIYAKEIEEREPKREKVQIGRNSQAMYVFRN